MPTELPQIESPSKRSKYLLPQQQSTIETVPSRRKSFVPFVQERDNIGRLINQRSPKPISQSYSLAVKQSIEFSSEKNTRPQNMRYPSQSEINMMTQIEKSKVLGRDRFIDIDVQKLAHLKDSVDLEMKGFKVDQHKLRPTRGRSMVEPKLFKKPTESQGIILPIGHYSSENANIASSIKFRRSPITKIIRASKSERWESEKPQKQSLQKEKNPNFGERELKIIDTLGPLLEKAQKSTLVSLSPVRTQDKDPKVKVILEDNPEYQRAKRVFDLSLKHFDDFSENHKKFHQKIHEAKAYAIQVKTIIDRS